MFDAAAVGTLLAESCQVMKQEVRAFRLARTAFPADDDALVRLFTEHAVIRGVGDREYVRGETRAEPLVLIQLDIFRIVDRVEFERI